MVFLKIKWWEPRGLNPHRSDYESDAFTNYAKLPLNTGTGVESRTRNLWLRRPLLYPIELPPSKTFL